MDRHPEDPDAAHDDADFAIYLGEQIGEENIPAEPNGTR